MHIASLLSWLRRLVRATLGRLDRLNRALLLLLAFWVCYVHLLPWATENIVRPRAPVGHLWSAPMRAVETPLSRWDARWYFTIATKGYSSAGPTQESTVRFYPLYPALMAATAWLTGITPLWAGTLVSVLAMVGTVLLLARRAREAGHDEAALPTTEALLFFPSAFVLVTVYADGLALFAMILSVMLARRGRWWGAGLAAAAVSLSRLNGCLVLLPLLVLALGHWRTEHRWRPLPALLLGLAGCLAYPAYLWFRFGDPLLYFHTRSQNWMQEPQFFAPFLWDVACAIGSALTGGPIPRSVHAMPAVVFPLNVAALLVMFWALGASLRKRRWDEAALMGGGCLLAISVGNLESLARHALLYFPIYLRLGETFLVHRTVRSILTLVLVTTQAALVMLFANWWFVL